jgi:hypothetical protein
MPKPILDPSDIDPGTNPGSFDPASVFVPTTGLHFLSLSSFDDVLPDGDRINLVIEGNDLPSDRVQLRLRTQPGMWFKGVESHAGGIVKLESEDGHTTNAMALRAGELGGATIILVKAKFLGVHTPMYELPGGALKPLLGRRVLFDWMSD